MPLEQADKVIRIGEAALRGDVLHQLVRGFQQDQRPVDPLLIDIIRKGAAALPAKQGRKIAGIHIELGGNAFQAQVLRQIKMNQGIND